MKYIKICGIKRVEDVLLMNEYKPDFIGFVFAKSKRQVTENEAWQLKTLLNKQIKTVGVFVNESVSNIARMANSGLIDLIQLHGDENIDYIKRLRCLTNKKIIKAVRVKKESDILEADILPVDYLLLDTYSKAAYGGTGTCFEWNLIPDKLEHPYFLAGGINARNLAKAFKVLAYAYDVSGGVEVEGRKSQRKIEELMNIMNQYRMEC